MARSGCPVGTLCSELQNYGGAAAKKSRVLSAEALAWMENQFQLLGKGVDSRGLAVHLLSATQGVSVRIPDPPVSYDEPGSPIARGRGLDPAKKLCLASGGVSNKDESQPTAGIGSGTAG